MRGNKCAGKKCSVWGYDLGHFATLYRLKGFKLGKRKQATAHLCECCFKKVLGQLDKETVNKIYSDIVVQNVNRY